MKTSLLLKYLKIAKSYASSKEETDFQLLSNVLIEGSEDNLKLICCDGVSGIEININNYEGYKIIGKFCVNIFDLYSILSSIIFEQDLEFKLFEYRIEIHGDNFIKKLPIFDPSNIYNIPSNEEWIILNKQVLEELKLSSLSSMNNDSFSISCQDQVIVSQVHGGLFLVDLSQDIEFITYKKYIAKIFIEEFTHIALNENRICFKGNNIKLFIPRVNETKKNIKNVLDWVEENLDKEFEFVKNEIIEAGKIINATIEKLDLNDSAILTFSKKDLLISSDDTQITIDYMNPVDLNQDIEIKLPKNSLKILEKIDSEKIKIKLCQSNNRGIYCEGGKMKFIGNLLR